MADELNLPEPVAYIWHQHLGEKTKSLRWSKPTQWDFAPKVEPLYTEEQVRELLRTRGVARLDGDKQ